MKKVIFSLAVLGTLLAQEIKPKRFDYRSLRFRYATLDMEAADRNRYDTLIPYESFPFGVVHLAGPDHKKDDIMTCVPEAVFEKQGPHTEFICDDSSRYGVVGMAFPLKGQR